MRNFVGLFALVVFALSSAAYAEPNACEGTDLEKEKCLSKAYIERMVMEKDANVVAGGIVMRPTFVNPTGARPNVTDTVTVGYYLTDREGKLIETTTTEDELATFPLSRLITCWKTAIPMMTVGSLYKVTCPSDTAYGDRGADGVIKGGAALTFRISLYAIVTP
jgi:FKBP-type peptidyl-prolyl cis-trans isomerase FkpA